MKVCVDLSPLCTDSRFRGHGVYALELGLALARARPPGLTLMALTIRRGRVRVEPCTTEVVERAAVDAGPLVPEPVCYALKRLTGPLHLARSGIDLFHATDPKGSPRSRRALTIATCHDLIPVVLDYPFSPRVLPSRARGVVERRRYRAFRHVIAVSERTRQDLGTICGVPASRTTVISHGVSDRFSPAAAPTEREDVAGWIGTRRPYFLYVGGFDSRKRVGLLLEAFARAQAHVDEVLVIAGRRSSRDDAGLRAAMTSLGVADRVRLAGHVAADRLPALYRQATAHTMLSAYEGFGLTLVEAMACGCPVLATSESATPEVAGGAAWLLDRVDAATAALALSRLAHEAMLRDRLRAQGLARATGFTWDRCARETLGVYARLLDRRATG